MSVICGRSVVYPKTPVSFTNKTDCYDITEILLKVALNTITLTLCSVHYYLNSIVFALLKESSKLAIVNELINILLKGKKKRYRIVYINMNYILYLIKIFIRYAQNQKIGMPTNLKFWEQLNQRS